MEPLLWPPSNRLRPSFKNLGGRTLRSKELKLCTRRQSRPRFWAWTESFRAPPRKTTISPHLSLKQQPLKKSKSAVVPQTSRAPVRKTRQTPRKAKTLQAYASRGSTSTRHQLKTCSAKSSIWNWGTKCSIITENPLVRLWTGESGKGSLAETTRRSTAWRSLTWLRTWSEGPSRISSSRTSIIQQ